jgi:hypothetical protein
LHAVAKQLVFRASRLRIRTSDTKPWLLQFPSADTRKCQSRENPLYHTERVCQPSRAIRRSSVGSRPCSAAANLPPPVPQASDCPAQQPEHPHTESTSHVRQPLSRIYSQFPGICLSATAMCPHVRQERAEKQMGTHGQLPAYAHFPVSAIRSQSQRLCRQSSSSRL